MKLRSALLAATVLAAPVAAKAEAISGLYIGAGAGANFLQDENIKSVAFPNVGIPPTNLRSGGLQTKARFDTGFVGVVSVGYGIGNGLRFELEGNYRSNKFNKIGNGGLGFTTAGGDEKKYGGMFNFLYDFDPNVLGLGAIFGFFPAAISPYVGLGAGYVWARSPIRPSPARGSRSARFPAWRSRPSIVSWDCMAIATTTTSTSLRASRPALGSASAKSITIA